MNENAENQEMDYEDTDDDSFGDDFRADMQSHFKERAADRDEEAAEDAAEQKRMERHTDSEGNFRSLKDAWEYNGDDIPADLGPGSPRAENYSVEQVDEYYADREAYIKSGGQKIAYGLTPHGDDLHRPKRLKLMKEDMEWDEKEASAKEEGRTDDLDRARYFRKDIAKQMNALPTPPHIEHAEKLEAKNRRDSLMLLFEEADNPELQTDRIAHDSAVLALEDLLNATDNILILPELTSKHGNAKPMIPKNALIFDKLPKGLANKIRDAVKTRDLTEPDENFALAHTMLEVSGYSPTGRRAAEPKKAKAKKKKSSGRDPKHMTQREYNAWRESNGASRY